mmetsp:Transcript_56764/g.135506  ORF Transcript_56764/g.135506 Transcript_56764/m.135506 type:complete len:386 (-) Transcript_56764:577-1734(-)
MAHDGSAEGEHPGYTPDEERFERLGAEPSGKAALAADAPALPYMLGRLGLRFENWQAITDDKLVLSVVGRGGYRLQFPYGPPQRCRRPNQPSCTEHASFVSESIRDAIEMGVLSQVPEAALYCVMALGVVVQGPKRRLIFNCRPLNKHLSTYKFKFESLDKEGRTVFAGASHGYSVDLKSAYYHIEIHEDSRQFLGIEWEGCFYQFNACPFGLSVAPFLLTKILKVVTKYWRAHHGLNLVQFMDDTTGAASSAKQARTHVQFVIYHLERLGFVIQHSKTHGESEPVPRLLALGTVVDFTSGKFRTSPKRKEAIFAAIKPILELQRPRVTARAVARVTGLRFLPGGPHPGVLHVERDVGCARAHFRLPPRIPEDRVTASSGREEDR